MNIINTKSSILSTLRDKSCIKQQVYDYTLEVFQELKLILQELVEEYNTELSGTDNRILLEYTDRGEFEVQLKIATDILVFSLHSNVFQFNRDHNVWENPYVKENPDNAYSGIINIYNFLTDSFKYNRFDDLGYLVARIFINREKRYLVEGKRQMGLLQNDLSQKVANKQNLRRIVETAMNYSLNFDLLVPPYDNVKILSVAQMMEKIQNSRVQTGKRLGFRFNSDDV